MLFIYQSSSDTLPLQVNPILHSPMGYIKSSVVATHLSLIYYGMPVSISWCDAFGVVLSLQK